MWASHVKETSRFITGEFALFGRDPIIIIVIYV